MTAEFVQGLLGQPQRLRVGRELHGQLRQAGRRAHGVAGTALQRNGLVPRGHGLLAGLDEVAAQRQPVVQGGALGQRGLVGMGQRQLQPAHGRVHRQVV